MRALVLHGADDLRLEDRPEPVPGPGEVVIAVEAALTCATDDTMPSASLCTAPCQVEGDCPPNHACRGIDGAPGLYCLPFE